METVPLFASDAFEGVLYPDCSRSIYLPWPVWLAYLASRTQLKVALSISDSLHSCFPLLSPLAFTSHTKHYLKTLWHGQCVFWSGASWALRCGFQFALLPCLSFPPCILRRSQTHADIYRGVPALKCSFMFIGGSCSSFPFFPPYW